MRFTKELRQKIVREFAEGHGGIFDPAAFVSEIAEQGSEHPAWEWFQWDDERAAHEFRLDQARDFARGLVLRFEVQTVHRGAMKIVETSMPLAMSPLGNRRDGGYYMSDPNDPAHMAELCAQASQSLRWFLSRYHAALVHVGSVGAIERLQGALEHAQHPQEKAA